MGRPLKIQKQGYAGTPGLPVNAGYPQINTLTDSVTPGGLTGTQFYGVVGGNVQNSQTNWPNGNATMADGSATFPVIAVYANIANSGQGSEAAWITRQKGQSKFLVTGVVSGATGVCFLSNVANTANITEGNMTVTVSSPDGTGNVDNVQMQRISNKYGLAYPAGTAQPVQYFLNFFVPLANATLGNVNITSNAGTFTANATTILSNSLVSVSGTNTGTGDIDGYTDPTVYYVTTTNGSSSFTLSTTSGGANVVTTAGNTTGLTFTLISGIISTAKSGAEDSTFTNGTGNITLVNVNENPL
jgi:hypothetical protein